MAPFLLRRTVQGIVIVLAVATLAFVLLHLAPGDPVQALLSDARVSEELRASMRRQFGLDRPLPVQFARYLAGLASGDLGFSISQQRPVADVLGAALPNTLLLMGAALALSFAAGIAIGALQGASERSRFDRLAGAITTTLATVPEFWLATGVMLVLAYWLRIFPVSGMIDPVMHSMLSPAGRALDVVRHMTLPVLSLTLVLGSVIARYQRGAMIDAWREPFLRTARAAGVPRARLVHRHALRNALLPIITLFGLALPSLVGGAVFVESVYAWPGLGLVAVQGVLTRDYSLVLAVVIVTSALVSAGGILADLLHAFVDPRMRRA
jgi:peptide/nickel transport system permease protein